MSLFKMKDKIEYLLVMLVCCVGCTCSKCSNNEPAETQEQVNLSVQFKYDTPIGDYIVEGTFYPFSETSETGQVEVSFRSLETGKIFVYRNVGQHEGNTNSPAKFSGYNIDEIVFSDNFQSWRTIDSLTFKYNTTREPYPDSPLLYAAEFQFFDIDNDGVEELLVNQWDRHRGGNYYDVFKVSEDGLKPIVVPGKESIDNMTVL